MATVIQFKRSSTQSAVPTTSDLALGEIAVNTYHGRVYTEKNDGSASIVEVGSVPASLTINDAYSFPTSDGSSGQALITDGSGTLSFSASAGSQSQNTFVYSPTTNTTAFTGVDDNGSSLSYIVDQERVYLNGILLVKGSDYTQTNTSTITLTQAAINGDTVTITTPTTAAEETNTVAFTTTASDQVLFSAATAAVKAVKFNLVAYHSSAGNHFAEVAIANDGTNSYISKYADTYTSSSLFTVATDISSGNVRLLITPTNTNTSVFYNATRLPAVGNSVEFTTTTADQVLSSLSTSVKAVKYNLVASHSSGNHFAEVSLTNDGSSAYFVQYGDVLTTGSDLFTLSADVSGGNQRLLITPANTNTTVTFTKDELTP